VVAAHGVAQPAAGLHTNDYGTNIDCRVSGVDGGIATQYVCAGWAMTGNAPASGSGTNFSMALTNDAVLTWQWTTQFYFHAESDVHGYLVGMTGSWVNAGQTASVTAVADQYYAFDQWHGTTGSAVNPLVVPMDAPCAVTAAYAVLTTDGGIPLTWLDGLYGLGTNSSVENLDPDNDGHTTLQEWWADTVPTNGDSVLSIRSLAFSNGIPVVEWQGGVLATQCLECAECLASSGTTWRVLVTNLPPTVVSTNYAHTGATNNVLFYRIRAGQL
jgi:hypothetical protein